MLKMSLYVQTLLLIKQHQERRKQNIVRSYILSLDTLPPELNNRPQTLQQFKDYVTTNDKYAQFSETHSMYFVNDLIPGRKHLDIHCMSYLQDNDWTSITRNLSSSSFLT
jgi:hypothetical protein